MKKIITLFIFISSISITSYAQDCVHGAKTSLGFGSGRIVESDFFDAIGTSLDSGVFLIGYRGLCFQDSYEVRFGAEIKGLVLSDDFDDTIGFRLLRLPIGIQKHLNPNFFVYGETALNIILGSELDVGGVKSDVPGERRSVLDIEFGVGFWLGNRLTLEIGYNMFIGDLASSYNDDTGTFFDVDGGGSLNLGITVFF